MSAANSAIEELGSDPAGADLTSAVLSHLYAGPLPGDLATSDAFDLMRAHPLVAALAEHATDAVALADLPRMVLGADATVALAVPGADQSWQRFLSSVVAALAHVRGVAGRTMLSIEAHLWVRELTRVDRAADSTAGFRWGDDVHPSPGRTASSSDLRFRRSSVGSAAGPAGGLVWLRSAMISQVLI